MTSVRVLAPARPRRDTGSSTTPLNNNFGTRPGNEAPSKAMVRHNRPILPNNGFGTRPAKNQTRLQNPDRYASERFQQPVCGTAEAVNNPGFQPAPSQPKRNEMKGRTSRQLLQPAFRSAHGIAPRARPRNVTPKNSPSGKNRFFDFRSNGSGRDDRGGVQESRPRQEKSSPTFQPRNEPKQFSQPSPSPRSSPSPSRPSQQQWWQQQAPLKHRVINLHPFPMPARQPERTFAVRAFHPVSPRL